MDIFQPILKILWKNTEKMDNKRIASQTPIDSIKEICDISYLEDGMKAHLLDIYYPESAKETDKLPVIIDIHGGGWMYGYKEINKYFCFKLAEKGFLVASINYRLADTVYFDDQIRDIFSAFHWLKENLSSYPADLNNVFLCGDSAGGHFACVSMATEITPDYQKDFGVTASGLNFKAVGAICPAIDLASPDIALNIQLKMLLGEKYKQSKLYKYMNFEKIASYRLPPFYVVTSNGDFLQKQAFKLWDILVKYNVECEFENYRDKINGKYLPHVFGVVDPYTEPAERFIKNMTDFFKSKIV